MSIQDKLLKAAAGAAPGGLTPSEHFGVVLYEGDGSSSHSINGGKFGAGVYGNQSTSRVTTNYIQANGVELTWSFWVFAQPISGIDTVIGAGTQFVIGLEANKLYPFINGSNRGAGTSITTNTWHHFAITYNGSGTTQVYKDGSLDVTVTGHTPTSMGTIKLFDSDETAWGVLEGKIDQVRIFQKVLSSSEVSTLYAETAATVESLDPLSEDTTDTLQVLGDSSCIATYRFENNEDDLSGNYDGTGTNIQYAAGRYGQAASFNGSASYIDPNGDWGVNGDSSHSVSFWVNFNSNSGTQHFYGIGDTVTAFTHTSLYIDSGLNTVVHDNNGNADNLATSLGLSTGRWYHFVLTYNSSDDGLEFYLDGVSKGTVTRTLNVTGDAVIGRRPYYATNYLNADLDQFRVFNKELSASEVTTLYNENSLVASYRFEGNANDDTRNYDGTATNVTYEYGLGFTPDFVWIKKRDATEHHRLYDSTRGVSSSTNTLYPSLTFAASTESPNGLASLDTGGFTVQNQNAVNSSGNDFVAWCLKANGGTTSSNTDGSITSTVQANTNSGFSIVTATAPSSGVFTVGHGLNAEIDLYIIKNTSSTGGWITYVRDLGADKYLELENTNAAGTSTNFWNNTNPTSSVFTMKAGSVITGGANFVAYCFKSIDSFSKIGSYTGNGSTNGPIVETGFEPAFLMIKRTDSTGDWRILDNKRSLTNPRNEVLKPNSSEAEESDSPSLKVDFLSNGFQLKSTHSSGNTNNATYIYMAFAADPDTEAPTVAKSFTTRTYTGTGSNRSIDGLGFSPSLLWLKGTSNTEHHYLYDTIRGSTKYLHSSNTAAQGTDSTSRLASFDDDGFSLFTDPAVNGSGQTYVAWTWKADDNEPTIFGGPAKAVYKFEDNANDVGGNYNGSVVDTVTYVTGNFNKAANFTASGTDKNEILTTLTESPSVGISLSCWVKFSTLPSGGADSTFVIKNSGTEYIHLRYEDYQSKGFSMQTKNSSSNVGAKSEMTASTGVWYHVVGTVNSGGTGKIYVNGDLKATNTGLPLPGVGSEAWRIGGFDTAQSTRGDYAIDQVRIYYDEIKQEQVDELYAETVSDNDDMSFGGAAKILVSANANAGFSIVKYEGTGVTGTRVPHGLSSAPELWIGKQLTGSAINWQVLYSGFSEGDYLTLNTNAAKGNSANVTFDPTATTVKFHANQALNDSGEEYIGYAFHSVSGYSKIGTYTGTGSSQTITTGFQPDWIVTKRTDTTDNWRMYDSVRQNTQPFDEILYPNLSNAEEDNTTFVTGTTSTGFTLGSGNGSNASGGTYIYMAFKIN